jgi:hypothetical protein
MSAVAEAQAAAILAPEVKKRASGSLLLEGDNPDHRKLILKSKLKDACAFILTRKAAGTATHEALFAHFNYKSAYDVEFLCMLAESLNVDISRATSLSRYTHKDVLNELIAMLLLR